MYLLAGKYRDGSYQDLRKSRELVHRAADLGHVGAIAELGSMYALGLDGISVDETKGRDFLERAAKSGETLALVNLGALEARKGRTKLGLTYLRTAAEAGEDEAVKRLLKVYMARSLSKDDLEKSLRAHRKANEDMRSEERERLKRWKKVQEKKKQEQAKA